MTQLFAATLGKHADVKKHLVSLWRFGWWWAVFAAAAACSDCEPPPEAGNLLVLNYYDSVAFNANRQLTAKKVRYDSIFTLQLADTLPLSQVYSTDSVVLRLPMPSVGDSVVFVMASTESIPGSNPTTFRPRYDTLSVGFDRLVTVVTPDCGVTENFENLRIGPPTSLLYELSVNFIDNNVDENVYIFH